LRCNRTKSSLKILSLAFCLIFGFILILPLNSQNAYGENSEPEFHEVTISTDKEVYKPRDKVTVTFTNTGNMPVSFHESSGGMVIKSLDEKVRLAGGGGYQVAWWMEPGQNESLTFGPFKGIPNGIYKISTIYAVPEGENGELVAYHPKHQFEIACSKGLELIHKFFDDSPACVKPSTVLKLLDRGWGG